MLDNERHLDLMENSNVICSGNFVTWWMFIKKIKEKSSHNFCSNSVCLFFECEYRVKGQKEVVTDHIFVLRHASEWNGLLVKKKKVGRYLGSINHLLIGWRKVHMQACFGSNKGASFKQTKCRSLKYVTREKSVISSDDPCCDYSDNITRSTDESFYFFAWMNHSQKKCAFRT